MKAILIRVSINKTRNHNMRGKKMKEDKTYFYHFLKPISKELAYVARELENSIFTSPRTMLTHARAFVEAIMEKVFIMEKLPHAPYMPLVEQIDILDQHDLLEKNVRDALHAIRMRGNQAAHDVRPFRYSEALLSWEDIHTVVTWFVEVYGPLDMEVPLYKDPQPNEKESYDMAELEVRLENLEKLLTTSIQKMQNDETDEANNEVAATVVVTEEENEQEMEETAWQMPGMTTIRKISYKGETVDIPYFLRDAFLLPQRFAKSERFLVRLGAEEQARIMSELPANLEGLHKHVKRYNETNDKNFFEELKVFIDEEIQRRQLTIERPGELFFFYKADYIVVTEKLSKIPLTAEEFTGIPGLLRQLNEDDIHFVGQLPRELVILAKYKGVGIGTVEKLFEQLKEK